jgi:hypothetical protein
MAAVMLVEILDRHRRVQARHRIAAPDGEAQCTVGRSAGCDIVLDDPFVAAVHARIAVDTEGNVAVTDLGSVNGIEVGGRRLHGVDTVPLADGLFGLGRTHLRVRTTREVLAPEEVAGRGPSWLSRTAEHKVLAAAFAASVTLSVFEVWTATAKPRDLSTALVTTLLTLFALAGLWVVLWALASRVAFGESRWVRHAMILFVTFAVVSVVTTLIEIASGALALHLPTTVVEAGLAAVGMGLALSGHLVNASPMRTRTAVAIGVAIPAVALSAILWAQAHSHDRSPTHIADHDRSVPPALLWRRGLPLDGFTAELARLRARADAKRAFVEREDPSPGEDDTE